MPCHQNNKKKSVIISYCIGLTKRNPKQSDAISDPNIVISIFNTFGIFRLPQNKTNEIRIKITQNVEEKKNVNVLLSFYFFFVYVYII